MKKKFITTSLPHPPPNSLPPSSPWYENAVLVNLICILHMEISDGALLNLGSSTEISINYKKLVAEKLSWFIRHLSDGLHIFYSNLWNLS